MSETSSTSVAADTGDGSEAGAIQQTASDKDTKSDEVKPKENGTTVAGEASGAAGPVKPKYRHDWYQTPTDVYINVMIKGLKSEDVSVVIEAKKASCCM